MYIYIILNIYIYINMIVIDMYFSELKMLPRQHLLGFCVSAVRMLLLQLSHRQFCT